MEIALPRYVTAKRLKSGATGFYWTCPVRYRQAGCPWHAGALGENLSQADLDEAAKLWNDRLDEWQMERFRPKPKERPLEEHFAYGTVGWLLDHYLTTDAFKERVAEPHRRDYYRILRRVCDVQQKAGNMPYGKARVKEFGVKAAIRVYEHFTSAGALRTAEKALIYCRTAWDRMKPHHPTLFRSDVPNPWEGVTVKKRDKQLKGHETRERVYQFAWRAVGVGKPELAAAAVLAFEWLMRPSTISAGYATWSNYRASTAPDKIKIRHRKNGGQVDHPLEAKIDGVTVLFYDEAEKILARVPRRGLSIVTKIDGKHYGDNTRLTQAIHELAEKFGMRGFTLDRARHGGMTELEESGLTEGQGKALSTHRSKAYQVYAKETEIRVLKATKKRFGYSEQPENDVESTRKKSTN